MNLEHTEIILKKINRLYELIKSFGEASDTEKDLLKAYVVDLYESVAMSDLETPEILEEKEMKDRLKKLKKQEKKLKKQVEKRKEEVEEVEEEEVPVAEIEEEEATPEVEEVVEEVPEPDPTPSIPQEMIDLFETSNGSELSDKLANAPIKDLTKAMGINEKIFTVKELFGGNQEEMDNILTALNGLSDFEEAKSVLMRSVASKYEWHEAAKQKKAKNFIKLVRRRYV